MSGIHEKVCVACQADAEPASAGEINQFVSETEWSLIEKSGVTQLHRKYNFSNFEKALIFTNKVGEIAEEEVTIQNCNRMGKRNSLLVEP